MATVSRGLVDGAQEVWRVVTSVHDLVCIWQPACQANDAACRAGGPHSLHPLLRQARASTGGVCAQRGPGATGVGTDSLQYGTSTCLRELQEGLAMHMRQLQCAVRSAHELQQPGCIESMRVGVVIVVQDQPPVPSAGHTACPVRALHAQRESQAHGTEVGGVLARGGACLRPTQFGQCSRRHTCQAGRHVY